MIGAKTTLARRWNMKANHGRRIPIAIFAAALAFAPPAYACDSMQQTKAKLAQQLPSMPMQADLHGMEAKAFTAYADKLGGATVMADEVGIFADPDKPGIFIAVFATRGCVHDAAVMHREAESE